MSKIKTYILIGAISIISGAFNIGCGSGGGDSSGSQTTVINGSVTNVVASAQKENKTFKLSKIIEILSFIKEAKAQGGILVTAIINGVTVASDVTNPEGDFILTFNLDSATNVLILFDVNGTEVSIGIVAEEGSIINLTVSIDLNAPPGEEVEIVDMEDLIAPINCENGSIEITDNINETLIIDGNGEDCIRTAGNCSLFINQDNLVLTNCENCVDARGTSDVTLFSPNSDITCEAAGDGFKTVGDAEITVDAFDTIDITAGENGLKADGNSFISLGANTCIIDSLEDPVDVNGNATVDTSGCGEVLTPGFGLSTSPESSEFLSLSP